MYIFTGGFIFLTRLNRLRRREKVGGGEVLRETTSPGKYSSSGLIATPTELCADTVWDNRQGLALIRPELWCALVDLVDHFRCMLFMSSSSKGRTLKTINITKLTTADIFHVELTINHFRSKKYTITCTFFCLVLQMNVMFLQLVRAVIHTFPIAL